MKKYILLLLLLTILSFTAYSQTSPTLPSGAKPYGNQLYILPSTGDIWGGNAGYKYRVVAKKSYVDSLTVLGYKKTQVDSLLALKQATIVATTSSDYYRGDKTFATLNKTAVGLSNVDNTSDANKPVSTATSTALNLKANLLNPIFSNYIYTGAIAGAPFGSVSVNNSLTGAYTDGYHGLEDHTTLNITGNVGGTGNSAFASVDAKPTVTGSNAYDHIVGLQSRPNLTGSASIATRYEGLNVQLSHNSTGTISNVNHIHIEDLAGGGSGIITNNTGLRINSILKGTNRFAIVTGSGKVSFGDNLEVTGSITNSGAITTLGNITTNTKIIVGTTSTNLSNGLFIRQPTVNAGISTGLRIINNGAGAGTGAGIELGFSDNANANAKVSGIYDGAGTALIFGTNLAGNVATERARIASSGNTLIGTTTDDGVNKIQINGAIKSTQFKLSALNTAPTSSTDTGTLGEIRVTSTYIYICTATNTWVRSALTTW